MPGPADYGEQLKLEGMAHTAPASSDEAYTPRWVFDAMGLTFDIDVAAPAGGPAHVPARTFYTAEQDGLTMPWDGLIWCNPPYSRFRPWAERWASCDQGALMGTYAPETYAIPITFSAADAVAFIGVKFHLPDGGRIKPRHGVFVAFRGVGTGPAERLADADRYGAVLYGRTVAYAQ
jgi:DNA N-6-adenine-methyltransferase (Dam)